MEQDEWVKYVADMLKGRPAIAIVIDAGEYRHTTPHTPHTTLHTPHTSLLLSAASGDYEAWLKLKAAVPAHVTLVGMRVFDSDMDLLKQGAQELW
jgi:hypothetical protein